MISKAEGSSKEDEWQAVLKANTLRGVGFL